MSKKRTFRKSLYWKISGAFLILMTACGVLTMVKLALSLKYVGEQGNQIVHWYFAKDLAQRFQPYLEGDRVDRLGALKESHLVRTLNPAASIYLLNSKGETLDILYGTSGRQFKEGISLGPIRRFLAAVPGETPPIFGDDPQSPNRQLVFSVHPIRIGTEEGFLYVTLSSSSSVAIRNVIGESRLAMDTFTQLLSVMFVSAVLGLVAFFVLTKRFYILIKTVREIEEGNLAARIPFASEDEMGELARTINRMSDTIEANVKELKRKDEVRRELVANVSHDLRGPVASLLGHAETLLIHDGSLAKESQEMVVQGILKSGQSLKQLIDDLFELSRFEAKEISPDLKPLSVIELAGEVVLKFEPLAEDQGITITCAPRTIPEVQADRLLIERVLFNLVGNAMRYTPRGGSILIDANAAAEQVTISVKDSGSGIPSDQLPYLFERFYQGKHERPLNNPGAGIGLAIVKKIVEAHGGQIQAESKPGEGSVFKFTLLRANPAKEPEPPQERALSEPA